MSEVFRIEKYWNYDSLGKSEDQACLSMVSQRQRDRKTESAADITDFGISQSRHEKFLFHLAKSMKLFERLNTFVFITQWQRGYNLIQILFNPSFLVTTLYQEYANEKAWKSMNIYRNIYFLFSKKILHSYFSFYSQTCSRYFKIKLPRHTLCIL